MISICTDEMRAHAGERVAMVAQQTTTSLVVIVGMTILIVVYQVEC